MTRNGQKGVESGTAVPARDRAAASARTPGRSQMKFTSLSVAGAYLIQQERREDERGFFARLWCEKDFRDQGLHPRIAQINTQVSRVAGTLSGMHFQTGEHAEVKIARCLRGAAFDVAVDLRPASPTFRRWVGVTLSGENGDMLYLPEGCAHGYLTL